MSPGVGGIKGVQAGSTTGAAATGPTDERRQRFLAFRTLEIKPKKKYINGTNQFKALDISMIILILDTFGYQAQKGL